MALARQPPDIDAFLRVARRPCAVTLAIVGLLGYFLYHVTRFQLGEWMALRPPGDASIVFDRARSVFALADYPARLDDPATRNLVFPYPPPAAATFRALTIAGPAGFTVLWLLAMAAGLAWTLRAGLAAERTTVRAAWPLLGGLALLLADAPVSWDLRNANSNVAILGLVIAAYAIVERRPAQAGALLGMSISLKLYGVLLVAWLALFGPRRAWLAALATLAALWIVLPLACFGSTGAIRVYTGWSEQLRIIGDPWVYAAYPPGTGGPPLVTLRRAAVTLTGAGPRAGPTWMLVTLLWAGWAAALVWYAVRALRSPYPRTPSRAALADWTVLLLAPLPFSPWLEPYHAVPLLAGALVYLSLLLDARVWAGDRKVALGACLALLAFGVIGVPFPIRGLGLWAQLVLVTVSLGYLRPRLADARTPGP